MTQAVKDLTASQQASLAADMAKRGVKFLPAQAIRRVVDAEAAKLPALGATRRAKAKRVLTRDAAIKQAAAAKDAAAAKEAAPKTPKPVKEAKEAKEAKPAKK